MIVNYKNILKEDYNWYNNTTPENRVIAWFSGGVASTVACLLANELYSNVEYFFCDTGREHPETFRLMEDFNSLVGKEVQIVSSDMFNNPEEVWRYNNGLNFATGAPCSKYLKSMVRIDKVQNLDTDYAQIFGFEFSGREIRRATNIIKNNAEINPKFPLIEYEYTREDLFEYLHSVGLEAPKIYKNFNNNNCLGFDDSPIGGCIKGGIGYWKQMKKVYPKKFKYMAKLEREMSSEQGKPVTVCVRQDNYTKTPVFLEFNPEFPDIYTIDSVQGKYKINAIDCIGFCE